MFDSIVAGVSVTSTSHAPDVRRRCWNKIAVRGVNVGASSADEIETMFVNSCAFCPSTLACFGNGRILDERVRKGMAIGSHCRDWTEMDNKSWRGNCPAGDANFCERKADHAEL